jgi:LmbE family N-acetylglucosaminyl deacetylase
MYHEPTALPGPFDLFERILAIGSHPDDVELGCFGTLARFQQLQSEITLCLLSDGGAHGLAEVRKKESEASAELLHARLVFGGLTDTQIPEGHPTISVIENVIAASQPTVILVPSLNDTHQDHRNTARASLSASRYVPLVLFYQTPSSTRQFNPTVYVDITDFIELKMNAIRLHQSQGKNVYMADRAVRGLAEFLGLQIYQSSKYFEGFEIHQMILGAQG